MQQHLTLTVHDSPFSLLPCIGIIMHLKTKHGDALSIDRAAEP
jgi:hypothetical protein